MKKIIVISDVHGNTAALVKLKPFFDEANYVFFLGDGLKEVLIFFEKTNKLIAVKGNCDFCVHSREKTIEVENVKFLLTHGDLYNVKYGYNKLSLRLKETGADAALFGHTHIAEIVSDNNYLLFNPGSLSIYTNTPSFGYLVVDGNKITDKRIEKLF